MDVSDTVCSMVSDTPIDSGLNSKASTRYSDWFDARVESFMEEYNEQISALDLDDDVEDSLRLDHISNARRRLIDFGLFLWATDQMPRGFAFDATELGMDDDAELACVGCGESDPKRFRATLNPTRGDFLNVYCLSCGHEARLSEQSRPEPAFQFSR